MTYLTEFPDFDHKPADVITTEWGFEDASWHNEPCPSFVCDVFQLWIDFLDPAKREHPNCALYTILCEGELYLETDDWSDVVAFVVEGKRDFPDYKAPRENTHLAMTQEFADFVSGQGRGDQGDAEEWLMIGDLTQQAREYLEDFVKRWEAA